MCGVFGYVGEKKCQQLILSGLKTLEYRGYDSAGIATVSNEKKITLVKKKGKLSALEQAMLSSTDKGTTGIGHTRWATHGLPNDTNAHPHVSKNFALIHNGIIENFRELKEKLLKKGVSFVSETDSEVILRLIEDDYESSQDIEKSFFKTINLLEGSFALGVFCAQNPEKLYLAKRKSPVILGKGKGENLFASDLIALTPYTSEFIFLEDEQVACLTKDKITIKSFAGNTVNLESKNLDNLSYSSNCKGSYRHYMLKEIHEQTELMERHVENFYDDDKKSLRDNVLGLKDLEWSKYKQIILTGCGSAYYSALVGRYMLEEVIETPIVVHLASELRYRKIKICPKTLVIAISQSGETADTLASSEFAKKQGCTILSICNTAYSSLTRISDYNLFMQAGIEVGVAATKTFTATLLTLLALKNDCLIRSGKTVEFFDELKQAGSLINEILLSKEKYKTIAEKYASAKNFFFIGRGPSYPIALEGALKLKEISYIHAEAYAGGELKHGPISLVTKELPTLAICPNDTYAEKMISNIEEVAARKGKVIAVGSPSCLGLSQICKDILPCPQVKSSSLQAILNNITLQLFAYYIADKLGQDIDQPRNLAKSVTVE